MENNNIITFNSIDEFNQFLRSKQLLKKLGSNTEGTCYLSSKDNLVYKILLYSLQEATSNEHRLSEIVTTKDINLKSFAFPQKLYAIRQKLVGYQTEYITPDLFNYKNLKENPESIYKIDFNLLKKAYYIMLKDVEKLSQENIKIVDLPCNIMFTGERLVGIDTCFYKRENIVPLYHNIQSLNNAIKDVFDTWLWFNLEKTERTGYLSTSQQDIEEYLDNIQKISVKQKKKTK